MIRRGSLAIMDSICRDARYNVEQLERYRLARETAEIKRKIEARQDTHCTIISVIISLGLIYLVISFTLGRY